MEREAGLKNAGGIGESRDDPNQVVSLKPANIGRRKQLDTAASVGGNIRRGFGSISQRGLENPVELVSKTGGDREPGIWTVCDGIMR